MKDRFFTQPKRFLKSNSILIEENFKEFLVQLFRSMITLNITKAIFAHCLSELKPPQFKVLIYLQNEAASTSDGIVEFPMKAAVYHCNLSEPTVGSALKNLEKMRMIRRLPQRSFHTERRYEVLQGNKINLAPQQNADESLLAKVTLASLNLSPEQLALVMYDLEDTLFYKWHETADVFKIKAELGIMLSFDIMKKYFSEKVFPLMQISDDEVVTTYHHLKGEGRLQ